MLNFRSLCLFALVICMMLATGTDAFAFGKRGGFFNRGQSCTSCGPSQCASDSCAPGCESGQCAPAQFISPNQPGLNQQVFMGNDGKSYKQVCENGKCFFVPLESGPATLGSKPITIPLKPVAAETVTLHKDGDAWKDASGNVWKK